MALIPTQTVTAAGVAPTTQAAAGGGDTIAAVSPDDTRTFLYVLNGGGAPITVTIADPGTTAAGNAGTPVAVTVAAGAFKLIGLVKGVYNSSSLLASVTYSAVTTVTVAALRV